MIALRHMLAAEVVRIGEIDRSEHLTQLYTYRCGALEARAVDEAVPAWSLSGDGEHSVQGMIRAWQPAELADLALLHVSRSYRRKGVASALTHEVARLARADGARRLYVSATPSGSAVGFYRSHGFEPTDEPNPELLALEPDDIHMILEL